MKINTHFLLTSALILMVPVIAHGVLITVRVNGTYDDWNTTTITAHNGLQGAEGIWAGVGTILGDLVWIPDGGVDENGEETGDNHTPVLDTYTEYYVTVQDDWIGKSITFSVDGIQWSALHLLLTDPLNVGFRAEDVGASPYSGTATDPSTSFQVLSNTLAIGKWWNDADKAVFTLTAWDNALPSWPCVGMDMVATAPNAYWRWMHFPGYIAMELDYLHRLTLRKAGSDGLNANGRIVLDPQLGRITVGGFPVLTAATASSQFVARSAYGVNLALNGIHRTQTGLPPQLILGRLNDPNTNDDGVNHTEGVLIVGTGTPAAGSTPEVRINGLRILDDGTVLIMPKGDLGMGTFDGGPKP